MAEETVAVAAVSQAAIQAVDRIVLIVIGTTEKGRKIAEASDGLRGIGKRSGWKRADR